MLFIERLSKLLCRAHTQTGRERESERDVHERGCAYAYKHTTLPPPRAHNPKTQNMAQFKQNG